MKLLTNENKRYLAFRSLSYTSSLWNDQKIYWKYHLSLFVCFFVGWFWKAVIKFRRDGEFYLKNLGKGLVFVNGRFIERNKTIRLLHNCLIEVCNSLGSCCSHSHQSLNSSHNNWCDGNSFLFLFLVLWNTIHFWNESRHSQYHSSRITKNVKLCRVAKNLRARSLVFDTFLCEFTHL